MLGFIDKRDPARPFMTYMFFESTHANYDFPPESAIAKPYLEDLNYLTADFKGQTALIKNRYINAAHHVDQQIGRIIDTCAKAAARQHHRHRPRRPRRGVHGARPLGP
jgi:membrane-anchored protein YejM (alkaline phosphatase superfamily)